jgi:hypothetical protein
MHVGNTKSVHLQWPLDRRVTQLRDPTDADRLPSLRPIRGMQVRLHVRGCTQKFPDWPPGTRTASGKTLCH